MIIKKSKRLLILVLCAALVLPGLNSVAAPTIRELENKTEALQKQLELQKKEFYNILIQIDELEQDIAENLAEIEETELNLQDAIIAEQEQYEAMKKRIQYNYENKEEDLFTIFISSQSFSDFLNRIEYANSIYQYDSQMLDSYEATRMEIEDIKADLEAQKAANALKQDSLSKKKQELSSLIESTKSQKETAEKALAEAKAEAARKAAEEAARRRAAREAARRAASAAAANAAAAASRNGGASSSGGGSQSAGGVVNADPAPRTNVSGSAVVSYANQFVGNNYVWGGNSLTSGVDCSGFVVQVYKNFGINLSGSRNSASLRYVGQPVSYDNMKAGDIICYAGHVGIYSGAGTIVEAQSTRAGITNNRSVNCKTILAIRRVI